MTSRFRAFIVLSFILIAGLARAQQPDPSPSTPADQEPPVHDHAAMMAAQAHTWHLMWDGVVFATAAFDGSARGENQFISQNWGMFMAQRGLPLGSLTFSTMLSLEPATVGAAGYTEIFQVGEAYKGLPVVDRQHPHDAFMQIDLSWRVPLGENVITISGGPSSSPALGPTAFPHRLSASDNPTAPLTHHTFDSTHVSMGVATLGFQRGWFTIEGSGFHGREPDWRRWNLDTGALDSASGRVTIKPGYGLEMQFSRGFLHEPEELEPGDQHRTNGSISWSRYHAAGGFSAVTVMAGRVSRTYSWTGALAAEGIHWMGNTAVFGRYEGTGIETEHLLFPQLVHRPHPGELVDPLHAVTGGLVRRLYKGAGMDLAVGGDLTTYNPPALLRPYYGDHPVSGHVFLRIRPSRSQPMDMDMSMPMDMPMDHSHH